MPNAFVERLSAMRLLFFVKRTNSAMNASDDAAQARTHAKLPMVLRTGPGPPLDSVEMMITNIAIAKANAMNDAFSQSFQRRASLPSLAKRPRSTPYAPRAA